MLYHTLLRARADDNHGKHCFSSSITAPVYLQAEAIPIDFPPSPLRSCQVFYWIHGHSVSDLASFLNPSLRRWQTHLTSFLWPIPSLCVWVLKNAAFILLPSVVCPDVFCWSCESWLYLHKVQPTSCHEDSEILESSSLLSKEQYNNKQAMNFVKVFKVN